MRIARLIAPFAFIPGVVLGHSGDDFIALESYGVGHVWEKSVDAFFDWEAYEGIDELSSSLSFSTSPVERIGLGADVSLAEDPNGDWVYSSVTPYLQVQLTDPNGKSPVRIGLTIGYQFAEDLSVRDTVTTYDEITTYETTTVTVPAPQPVPSDPGGGTAGDGGDPNCNPLFDLDCEPAAPPEVSPGTRQPRHVGHPTTVTQSTSTTVTTTREESREVTEVVEKKTTVTRGRGGHTGIHNHDARQWMGRVIVETDLGKTRLTGNLIATFPDSDHAYWGYGIGARRPLVGNLAFGLEAIGDFLPGGEHEIITSLHYETGTHSTIHLGTGFGIGAQSSDFTLRTGFGLRF